jgi:hypothetical protein
VLLQHFLPFLAPCSGTEARILSPLHPLPFFSFFLEFFWAFRASLLDYQEKSVFGLVILWTYIFFGLLFLFWILFFWTCWANFLDFCFLCFFGLLFLFFWTLIFLGLLFCLDFLFFLDLIFLDFLWLSNFFFHNNFFPKSYQKTITIFGFN